MLKIFLCLIGVLILTASAASAIKTEPPQPDWINHLSVIVPGVTYAFKMMIWAIGTLIGVVSTMLGIGLRIVWNQFKDMRRKMDDMYLILMACEGCGEAAEKIGHCRRADDVQ